MAAEQTLPPQMESSTISEENLSFSPETEFPGDYSDALSPDAGGNGDQRRRYQRGGRRKTQKTQRERIPPLEENHTPRRETDRQTQTDEDLDPYILTPPRSNSQPRRIPKEKTKTPTDFATGIRAFNVRKATGSGGRPIGVRSVPLRPKKKTTTKTTSTEVLKEEQYSDPEMQDIEEGSEHEEEEKPKPMSIRLDLNLVLEVFLKAKIQGDVTITFLE